MTEPKRVAETADPPTETGVAAPILVVMGVSGTGKSTVAGMLAGMLRWELIEGDELIRPRTSPKWKQGDR
jgi:cytidylate kinase